VKWAREKIISHCLPCPPLFSKQNYLNSKRILSQEDCLWSSSQPNFLFPALVISNPTHPYPQGLQEVLLSSIITKLLGIIHFGCHRKTLLKSGKGFPKEEFLVLGRLEENNEIINT
jgi:hypothetical protein